MSHIHLSASKNFAEIYGHIWVALWLSPDPLQSENLAGAQFAEGVAERCILPLASLQGRVGAARLRVGAVDVLVVARYYVLWSTKNSGDITTRIWVGLRLLRQARRSHHAAVDGRCKRRFWLGQQ